MVEVDVLPICVNGGNVNTFLKPFSCNGHHAITVACVNGLVSVDWSAVGIGFASWILPVPSAWELSPVSSHLLIVKEGFLSALCRFPNIFQMRFVAFVTRSLSILIFCDISSDSYLIQCSSEI